MRYMHMHMHMPHAHATFMHMHAHACDATPHTLTYLVFLQRSYELCPHESMCVLDDPHAHARRSSESAHLRQPATPARGARFGYFSGLAPVRERAARSRERRIARARVENK